MTLKAWLITPWAADTLFDSYQAIEVDDLVIAVDGGLKCCKELALTAHYLCGDLDSLDLELSESFPADKLWRFPRIKMKLIRSWQWSIVCSWASGNWSFATICKGGRITFWV